MKKKSVLSVLLAVQMLVSTVIVPSFAQDVGGEVTGGKFSDAGAYSDGNVSLWFDYSGEKTEQSDTVNTEMSTFTVYMAKNEIENAQFFLTAETAVSGMTASVSDFTDAYGNSIAAEIYIEYYHDCGDYGSVPDAIPPLSAYGAFELTPGHSQGFLIKIKTTEETVAGDYSTTLTVSDGKGNVVASAPVYLHVWDFALSEETACATSIWLSYSCLESLESELTARELYKIYYDYLLENRINAAHLPVNLNTKAAAEYIDDPRVTSFQLGGFGGFSGSDLTDMQLQLAMKYNFSGEKAAERFDKAYYFTGVVDADGAEDLKALYDAHLAFDSKVSAFTDMEYNLISTYIFDIDYTLEDGTVIDQIDYYDDFVNLWCSKTFAYTSEEELATVNGAKVLQPLKWNPVYGTFKERMEGYQAEGDKVWWFISWDVEEPYINYYMQTDGVAQRLLFWQQYDNDVEGFLYNFVNYWAYDTKDPYANNVTNSAYPNAHGESILLYPGDVYGIDEPVGSLRLEAMRDGIEDYQLFSMLDELCGEGASDEILHSMTTGVVTYSTDDASYYRARVQLGNAVEAAVKAESQPDYIKGDVDGDGDVTMLDLYKAKLFLKQTVEPTDAEKVTADIDGDGDITMLDSYALRYRISTGNWKE